MVCVPCVLVPLLLFLWGIIKPMLNWFRTPVENSEDQNNAGDDQVCSLLSSCPCINKNKKSTEDQVNKTNTSETSLKEPLETSDTDKKNL
ncbi:UPF0729 protein CG18508 [Melanaphis sacchari]|uniref:UPF0729 protein CG18508 n=1 Tax=Melanaphis sacchari TaxID=742174 RepID=UPI000DC12FE3|nr:UPF0729 protein CG18508 [Melanaphis sacchari]XP_025191983.1 UPF0729 protein CG18508 [Melanaphis sacchari]XP_025191984.1 UPF0729 protein CG18508 [Melanaphis sacchari]